MKVKELKELLGAYPNDMEVWTSSDQEGNELSPVAQVGIFETHEYEKEYDEWIVYEGFENYSPGDEVLMIWP